jgi:membrane-bound inhibitor of C-type lysozyme
MTRSLAHAAALITASTLAACSGSFWPFARDGSATTVGIADGATQYTCADGKRLLVRYAADGKSAWIIYPNREFRLDQVPSGSGERFTNGVSTLHTKRDAATLEEGGSRLFVDCRRNQGAG